jgi:hypothetical protein
LNKAQPSWNYTILVRSEDKGKDVQKQYPDVKLAIASLDDSEVIKKAASEADIVIRESSYCRSESIYSINSSIRYC